MSSLDIFVKTLILVFHFLSSLDFFQQYKAFYTILILTKIEEESYLLNVYCIPVL